jgi:osmotically-inducible protein OsmY
MKWKIAFIALMLSLLSGCAALFVGGVATGVGLINDRRPAGVYLEDEGIETRGTLAAKSTFGNRIHLNLTSYNKHLLISGEVPDEATKAGVENTLRLALPAVTVMYNELQIGELASFGSVSNDTGITAKVKGRFIDAAKFNALQVKVVTENGVVYLLGLVTQKEAIDAVEIARTTYGVRKVVRLFEYVPQ